MARLLTVAGGRPTVARAQREVAVTQSSVARLVWHPKLNQVACGDRSRRAVVAGPSHAAPLPPAGPDVATVVATDLCGLGERRRLGLLLAVRIPTGRQAVCGPRRQADRAGGRAQVQPGHGHHHAACPPALSRRDCPQPAAPHGEDPQGCHQVTQARYLSGPVARAWLGSGADGGRRWAHRASI